MPGSTPGWGAKFQVRIEVKMLETIFQELMSSSLGGEINSEACEHDEHFIVLHFWDGRRHMLTCPKMESDCSYDHATGEQI